MCNRSPTSTRFSKGSTPLRRWRTKGVASTDIRHVRGAISGQCCKRAPVYGQGVQAKRLPLQKLRQKLRILVSPFVPTPFGPFGKKLNFAIASQFRNFSKIATQSPHFACNIALFRVPFCPVPIWPPQIFGPIFSSF